MSVSAQKLRELKPGESCIYYRGRLAEDIERCAPRAGEQAFYVKESGRQFGPGAPAYGKLLAGLRATAVALEHAGVVILSEREEMVPPRDVCKRTQLPDGTWTKVWERLMPIKITQYIATSKLPAEGTSPATVAVNGQATVALQG